MRLGRNFTNLLYFDYLSDDDKRKFEAGGLNVADMDATVQMIAKGDIVRQVLAAKAYSIDHIEFDGAVPNPYLTFTQEDKQRAKNIAHENGITLSLHLPYSYVGASLCAPDEVDRQAASDLQKRYIEFASDLGCKCCVLHPGIAPFHHANGKYLEQVRNSLIKSLLELATFAADRGIELHLENNTVFERVFVELSEICEVLEEVRGNGAAVYFCFDIGHWLTRADVGMRIPSQPERILEGMPDGMFKELHLNDYVPGKRIFHPPLHEGIGLLRHENLKRYAELVSKKGVELIVVETAAGTKEQVMQRDKILREETEYLRSIFG
ncbi:MAG: sugar phosphate isomerase/epimerase family protein [Candidatus Hodarchaeaceae archaeon]|nr:sugar phosphate isomerase/epimerase family protein [Candidatus Hodarchaeaceae archaeon]